MGSGNGFTLTRKCPVICRLRNGSRAQCRTRCSRRSHSDRTAPATEDDGTRRQQLQACARTCDQISVVVVVSDPGHDRSCLCVSAGYHSTCSTPATGDEGDRCSFVSLIINPRIISRTILRRVTLALDCEFVRSSSFSRILKLINLFEIPSKLNLLQSLRSRTRCREKITAAPHGPTRVRGPTYQWLCSALPGTHGRRQGEPERRSSAGR